jgi:flagellar biosynthesis anti-sigma factor FlgM
MKINHIAQTYGVDLKKVAGQDREEKAAKLAKKSDEVKVSKEALLLQESQGSVEAASTRIESLPDVRWDKVQEAKQKIQNGFYNTDSFRSELADRLIKDFGLDQV